ncbi:hypothetical protein SAMN04489761_3031 [Tenacibaculum sp. MAR_2009_124]|nr:hypothetical protein SAMN04489761_3031 [Tenacibaculum sp. MAR_2009_124]
MWIVPKNIETNKEYYLFATDTEVLKEEFLELSQLNQSLMWRSKLFKTSTWWQRWNRVWWIKHLFGRILKPSKENLFITKYTESLEVIRAKEKALLVKENYGMTNDSFGRILKGQSMTLDLFGASLKTSPDTSQDLSPTFLKAYEIWVTQLRQESTQRQKLARHIKEKGFSFSRWITPTSMSCKRKEKQDWEWMGTYYKTAEGKKIQSDLQKQVLKWSTPTTRDGTGTDCPADRKRNSPGLPCQVNLYPTPQASETEKAAKNTKQDSLSKRAINGQLDQEKGNLNGKNTERLNPAWVAQLMGTTLGQSFYANMVTEL